MSKLEYTLQAGAWALIGVVGTLIYQRIYEWYKGRQPDGSLTPVGSAGYFGSLLIFFAIISNLFSYSNYLQQRDTKRCQNTINQHNVSIANTREANVEKFAKEVRDAKTLAEFKVAAQDFLDDTNPLPNTLPSSSCN